MFSHLKKATVILTLLVSQAAFADLAIIVHPAYQDGELNSLDLRNLFLGERNAFPNGENANPINHIVGSPDRKEFFSSVLSMTENNHKRHWRRKFSVGSVNQPVELNSHAAVLKTVSSTPGGISYIDARVVNDQVKVLMVLDENGIVIN